MNFNNIKLGETSISSLNDLKPYLEGEYKDMENEIFISLGFDSNLRIVMAESLTEISHKNEAYVSLDKLFNRLKETKSTGFVVSHNHTNGWPLPSKFDIKITDKISDIASKNNLVFFDHIIAAQLKDGCIFWWSIKKGFK